MVNVGRSMYSGCVPLRLSRTLAAITRTVRANPGLTIEAAILATRHHYRDDATALRALPRWIRAGMVPGITILCGALFPFALVDDGPQPEVS
ncbi:MAG: hypothetical protein KBD62_36010 [Kofleriaceae bacterium]|nr:hypothetical protein [Kofleriaceae bacterium]